MMMWWWVVQQCQVTGVCRCGRGRIGRYRLMDLQLQCWHIADRWLRSDRAADRRHQLMMRRYGQWHFAWSRRWCCGRCTLIDDGHLLVFNQFGMVWMLFVALVQNTRRFGRWWVMRQRFRRHQNVGRRRWWCRVLRCNFHQWPTIGVTWKVNRGKC